MTRCRPTHATCVLALLVTGLTARAPVSAAQMDEGVVKAAALLKAALFVDWPAGSVADRFVIGVAADEEFSQKVMEAVRGRRMNDRDIVVRPIGDTDEECSCQVLFVAAGEDDRSAALLRASRTRPVLTVGETTAFLREGGIVRVFRSDDRLRLQINNKGAEDAGLKISSRLLRLAERTP